LNEAATNVMQFFDSSKNHQFRVFQENQNQRTIGSGYFKTLRELFGFHERTTSFYSSRVGTMKWEQTTGNIPIYSFGMKTNKELILLERTAQHWPQCDNI
jgi:hypothetical protein